MSKIEPLMELLVVTFNEKDKVDVVKLIRKYTKFTLTFQSFGSLESKESFWNFDVIKQCTLISIIPASFKNEILIKLKACLNLDKKHQGIAFTLPFDSTSEFLFNKFKNGGANK